MFVHLLFTDAISWFTLVHIRLTEEETTSSSGVFLKILFQQLAEYMKLPKRYPRLKVILPRGDSQKTHFAINFFRLIGLGGIM